jgi:1-deoxy-D-xylulose-5-phosphate synthase
MLLETIQRPDDLRQLPDTVLESLAEEIREAIIKVVAQNGGHLASNLGVVELTIALHQELNCPDDQIVWDVGHQTYAHKLLTGRLSSFGSLRTRGGLSGFPKREESPFDCFNTGHSTTSISAALGLLEGRWQRGENGHVVAVIGDGALTGGMAWEALNHTAHLGRPLIVVLNDNEMSISPNVGAIAKYLNRLRTTPFYRQAKKDLFGALSSIPRLGGGISSWARRLKGSFKYLFIKGVVFEELGFTYLGPIDGHDIGEVRLALRQAKASQGPVVIHCITQKGRGYSPAESRPSKYHSAAPFVVATGARSDAGMGTPFTDVFGQSMLEIGARDTAVVAVSAAMIDGTGLSAFAQAFPHRTYDVGIAEQHAVTFAGGLSCQGLKPVVAVYSTFLQRAYDQILHDICLQRLPVVFAVDRAGVVGEDGDTHHGLYDLSYLRTMPTMRILAPCGAKDLPKLLEGALSQAGGPVAIRYPRDLANNEELDFNMIEEATDVLLVGVGPLYWECHAAAGILQEEGIDAQALYCPQVWPISEELLLWGSQASLVVTVEDNVVSGGFGSALREVLSSGVCVKSLAFADGFVSQAPRRELLREAGLTRESIVGVVREWQEKD